MRLISWSVDGYRNLCDVELDFSDGIILVGDNNSGKSNLIRSLFDYSALFGTLEQNVPEHRYIGLPRRQDIIVNQDDEEITATQIDQRARPDMSYPDWIDERVSDGGRIIFEATFARGNSEGADSEESASAALTEYAEQVVENRESRSDFPSFAEEVDGFNTFTHKLAITADGIEAEYVATEINNQKIVIAGRLPSGQVTHILYPMLRRDNDSVPITELELETMTPEKLAELSAGEPESREDHIWFEPEEAESANEHGDVIHSGLREYIRDDIRNWSHVPAVRRPPEIERYDLEAVEDGQELEPDFGNLLSYIRSPPDGIDGNVTQGYVNIIEGVIDINISRSIQEGSATVEGQQSEVDAERRFSSTEISTGSWEVLCLLAGIESHLNVARTDDEDADSGLETASRNPGSVLAIEEPETHLNPRTQRVFVNTLLGDIDERIAPIVTSHSPTIIDEGRLGQPAAVSKSDATRINPIDRITLGKIHTELGITLSEIMSANTVLLVPSHLWQCMIRAAASTYSVNPLMNGVQLVTCTSISQLEALHTICELVNTTIASITEWDQRDLIDEAASMGDETVYRFEIEELGSIRDRLQTPYSYLHSKVGDDVPDTRDIEGLPEMSGVDENAWPETLQSEADSADWTVEELMYHTVCQAIESDSPLDELIATLQGFIEATPVTTTNGRDD